MNLLGQSVWGIDRPWDGGFRDDTIGDDGYLTRRNVERRSRPDAVVGRIDVDGLVSRRG